MTHLRNPPAVALSLWPWIIERSSEICGTERLVASSCTSFADIRPVHGAMVPGTLPKLTIRSSKF